jgi:hypothetical protein
MTGMTMIMTTTMKTKTAHVVQPLDRQDRLLAQADRLLVQADRLRGHQVLLPAQAVQPPYRKKLLKQRNPLSKTMKVTVLMKMVLHGGKTTKEPGGSVSKVKKTGKNGPSDG